MANEVFINVVVLWSAVEEPSLPKAAHGITCFASVNGDLRSFQHLMIAGLDVHQRPGGSRIFDERATDSRSSPTFSIRELES